MLQVSLVHPETVRVYRLYSLHYRSPNNGRTTSFSNTVHNIVVGFGAATKTYSVDVGSIQTEPSAISGCNNCKHWDVDGHLEGQSSQWYALSAPYDTKRNQVPHRTCTITQSDGSKHTVIRALTAVAPDQPGDIPDIVWTRNDWWDGREIYTLTSITAELKEGSTTIQNSTLIIKGTETLSWEEHPSWSPQTSTFTMEVTLKRTSDSWWETGSYSAAPPARLYFPSYHWEFGERNRELIDHIGWRADREYAYGDATDDAAESIRLVNINSIAYLKDFAEIGALAKQVVGLAGKVYKPLGLLGKAATAYLTVHYGMKLTVQDTLDIADAVNTYQLGEQTQTMGAEKTIQVELPGGSGLPVAVSTRMTGVVDYFSNDQLYFLDKVEHSKRALYELDLVPSMANLWDMVPLSFVGDWFVPLGDAMEDIELHNYEHSLSVHKAFYSRKITWAAPEEIEYRGYLLKGTMSYRYYERICSSQLFIPPVRVDRPKGLSGHWIEATALILSRL